MPELSQAEKNSLYEEKLKLFKESRELEKAAPSVERSRNLRTMYDRMAEINVLLDSKKAPMDYKLLDVARNAYEVLDWMTTEMDKFNKLSWWQKIGIRFDYRTEAFYKMQRLEEKYRKLIYKLHEDYRLTEKRKS